MKRSTVLWFAAAALTLALPALAQQPPKLVGGQEASADVGLRDLQIAPDGAVKGTIVNNAHGALKGVKLLVKHTWYWKDERHPGEDSPGRSGYVTVPTEIPVGGSVPFTYTPEPPLPKRTDGSFQTTVGVQEFSQVGE